MSAERHIAELEDAWTKIIFLENALRDIVNEFETDFVLDGVIVDNPPVSMIYIYEIAMKSLGKPLVDNKV